MMRYIHPPDKKSLLIDIIFPALVLKMVDDTVLIRKGSSISEISRPDKLYKLMVKSDKMEALIAELEPHAESRWFQHDGEEMHLVLEGELEYSIDEKTYNLNEGDILWHRSSLRHRARNVKDHKTVYITIGAPPTFSLNML
jgi:quercetin dioxygenase-like cupin family protein